MTKGVGEPKPPANALQAQRWNGASGLYWIRHRERHLAEQRRLTPHLYRAAGISPGERVLDIGCGCGSTTIAAARVAAGDGTDGIPGSAVGLDLSAPMLRVARELAAQAGQVNARFVQGDAQACPLRGKSFDVVMSNYGVMFFEDPDMAFARIAAVTRPGGRLAFLSWQDDTQNEMFAIPLRVFATHGRLPGLNADDLFADPHRIEKLLSDTGWDGIGVTPITEPARIGSDVNDVMSYVLGMPRIQSLLADLADQNLAERMMADVADKYVAREHPGGVWVRAAAWLVTARRGRLKIGGAFVNIARLSTSAPGYMKRCPP